LKSSGNSGAIIAANIGIFLDVTKFRFLYQSIARARTARAAGQSRAPKLSAAGPGTVIMKFGPKAGSPRHCLECGKLIAHRRITALYCSGKCREIHNAKKRRQAREEVKNGEPAASQSQIDK